MGVRDEQMCVDRMSRAETTSPPAQGDNEMGAGSRVKVDKMDISIEGTGTRELHESTDKVEAVATVVRTAAYSLQSYPLLPHAMSIATASGSDPAFWPIPRELISLRSEIDGYSGAGRGGRRQAGKPGPGAA
jgi:hypothetical protein